MSVASAKSPSLEFATTVVPAQASGTVVIFNKVLPIGKWLVTGSVVVSAAGFISSEEILTPVRTLYKQVLGAGADLSVNQVPVSFLYDSNGTTALTISVAVLTEAGNWSSASTLIEITKLLSV